MKWLSMSLSEIECEFESFGTAKYRARQFYEWLNKGAQFDQMTNLPNELLGRLKEKQIGGAQVIEKRQSKADDAAKYLFLLEDGNIIEVVLMRYHHGNTVCISTQVGCRMGCAFCASTLNGLIRDLEPGEMLGQVLGVERELGGRTRSVTNVVLMGSGEPLDNFENVLKFIHLISCKEGLNISQRNISLSTCGLPDKIIELAKQTNVTLSISLHAPNDEVRKRLMPIAYRHTIKEVILSAKKYVEMTGRRVIFEYALIDGINSSLKDAEELAAVVKGFQCHVNLIPLNTVDERELKGASRKAVYAFRDVLLGKGISATIRRELASDIDGACGQLRNSYLSQGVSI